MNGRTMLLAALCSGALLMVGCGDDAANSSVEEPTSPAPETPLDIEVVEDVPYSGERTLDVYRPAEGSGWPLLVHFHGGVSTPEQSSDIARAVAQQGVVVVVPEWRSLGPAGGSEDTVCAVAFAAAHAEDYGASRDRIVLSGYSTGGYTAVVHALTGDDPPLPVTDCEADPVIDPPDAVVGGGAPLFAARWARDGLLAQNPQWSALTPEQIDAVDPYLLLGRNPDLEVRLLIGADDVGGNPAIEFPIAEANRDYLDALLNAGYDAELTEVPGGHQAPITPGPEGLDAYVATIVETARGA